MNSNIKKSIQLYPNPYSEGKLSVQITGYENISNVQFKILNLLGQTIYQTLISNSSQIEVDLSGKLNESIYLVSIGSGNNQLIKKLIVK